ncbi:MAG: hypothetical protein JW969_06340 [Spirochaetales bacterium]|nr:hypothetical protein [Spirochaetales bacterium]
MKKNIILILLTGTVILFAGCEKTKIVLDYSGKVETDRELTTLLALSHSDAFISHEENTGTLKFNTILNEEDIQKVTRILDRAIELEPVKQPIELTLQITETDPGILDTLGLKTGEEGIYKYTLPAGQGEFGLRKAPGRDYNLFYYIYNLTVSEKIPALYYTSQIESDDPDLQELVLSINESFKDIRIAINHTVTYNDDTLAGLAEVEPEFMEEGQISFILNEKRVDTLSGSASLFSDDSESDTIKELTIPPEEMNADFFRAILFPALSANLTGYRVEKYVF